MLEKGKINPGEFQVLVIFFTIGSSILVAPALLAKLAKQDAWIAEILTLMLGLGFVFLYNQLSSMYPAMTFVELCEKVFGKWLGKVASLLFLFYFYYLAAALLREIGDFLTTQVMVETPIHIIMIMFLMVSLVGVRLGLEVLTRTSLIFFPWTVVLLVTLFLFLIPEIKLENMQPMAEGGLKPILNGAFSNLGLPFLELAIFLMITPYVTDNSKMRKYFYSGTLIGGIILVILIIFSILILGFDMSSRQAYPSYVLGKKISIGDFLERIEAIVAIIWFFTMYFKLTITYYGLTLGLAQVFGLKSFKILLFPLAFLIITYAIFSHPDIVDFQNFLAKTWTPFSLSIGFLLPLSVLIVGKIRKNRSKKTPKSF